MRSKSLAQLKARSHLKNRLRSRDDDVHLTIDGDAVEDLEDAEAEAEEALEEGLHMD